MYYNQIFFGDSTKGEKKINCLKINSITYDSICDAFNGRLFLKEIKALISA
jgi:hypothetical protein